MSDAPASNALLDVSAVKLAFGGVKAVNDVSLSVRSGSITGLIGTNGAGKTTLFNIVSGFLKPNAGRIALDGADITPLAPHAIAERGLIRTFQTAVGFPRLTVMENMLVFSQADREARKALLFSAIRVNRATRERAEEILASFGLAGRRNHWCRDLSSPELKMLEFARAMMARPRLMLLDEPAAGINPALMESLAERIKALRAQGVSFLLVDHNLRFVCDVCDEVYAMADGRVIAQGPTRSVIEDPKVLELYIGPPPEETRQ